MSLRVRGVWPHIGIQAALSPPRRICVQSSEQLAVESVMRKLRRPAWQASGKGLHRGAASLGDVRQKQQPAARRRDAPSQTIEVPRRAGRRCCFERRAHCRLLRSLKASGARLRRVACLTCHASPTVPHARRPADVAVDELLRHAPNATRGFAPVVCRSIAGSWFVPHRDTTSALMCLLIHECTFL